MSCPCGNNKDYTDCCQKIHLDQKKALSAEMLMRSRYTAFVKHDIEFLYNSFHTSTRRFQNKKEIEQWAVESKWMHLEILNTSNNTVEFKAHYLDPNLELQIHHEKSNFKEEQGIWHYVDGKILS